MVPPLTRLLSCDSAHLQLLPLSIVSLAESKGDVAKAKAKNAALKALNLPVRLRLRLRLRLRAAFLLSYLISLSNFDFIVFVMCWVGVVWCGVVV
jgi:hypothetical protein